MIVPQNFVGKTNCIMGNVKAGDCTFCVGHDHKTTTFFSFSRTFKQTFRIRLQKNSPTFDELNEME